MSKAAIRITPVSGYDLPGLERWLEKRAGRGLRFAASIGILTLFERTRPGCVTVHLEPTRTKADQEDPELVALYAEAGWECWGIFRSNFHVFATAQPDARAHTDRDALDYSLLRFIRQRLLGGLALLLLNVLLYVYLEPKLYWDNVLYFPALSLAIEPVVAVILAAAGIVLADLSYLHGMWALLRLRSQVRREKPLSPAPFSRLAGLCLSLGCALLLVVGFDWGCQLFRGYDPIPYEESGWPSLTWAEGEDFRLSQDHFYNMDYISHNDSPLTAGRWYFHQYASFPQWDDVDPNTLTQWELRGYRYLLPSLAHSAVRELQRWMDGRSRDCVYQPLQIPGLDEALYAQDDQGMTLILRQGGKVLRVVYQNGSCDLREHLDWFLPALESL